MASTSSVERVLGPNTGIVPGPTRIASATSIRLEEVTGGANVSGGANTDPAPRCAADNVPPMPVDEWQAAQLARYSSAPRASGGGFAANRGMGGPAGPNAVTKATIDCRSC